MNYKYKRPHPLELYHHTSLTAGDQIPSSSQREPYLHTPHMSLPRHPVLAKCHMHQSDAKRRPASHCGHPAQSGERPSRPKDTSPSRKEHRFSALTALQRTVEMAPGPGKVRKHCWPFVLALPSSDKHVHLCLPGSSRCRPPGLPCERGISVPRQSGSHHRECHHFFADSVLRGRCHCEILSGTASGPSAFLECYKESKEALFILVTGTTS